MSSLPAKLGCLLVAALVAFALLAPFVCAPPPNLTGTWIGYRPIAGGGEDPAAQKTLARVELSIDNKGRFSLFERGLPKTGIVKYSGGEAELEIREILGQPLRTQAPDVIDQHGPISLQPLDNGSLRYVDSKRPDPVILTRKSDKD